MPEPVPVQVHDRLSEHRGIDAARVTEQLLTRLARGQTRRALAARRSDAPPRYAAQLHDEGHVQLFEIVWVSAEETTSDHHGGPRRMLLARARKHAPQCEPDDELLLPVDLPREAAAAAWLELRREDQPLTSSERVALEDLLRALMASDGPVTDLPATSVGAALRDDGFVGLRVDRGDASVEVRGSALECVRRAWTEERRWWVALDLRLRLHEVEYDLLLTRDEFEQIAGLCVQIHDDAHPQLRAALADLLERIVRAPGQLTDLSGPTTMGSLLDRLMPDVPDGSLAHWLETGLLPVLQPDGAPMVREPLGEYSLALEFQQIDVVRTFERFAIVRGTLRLVVFAPDQTIVDLREHQLVLGALDVDPPWRPLDDQSFTRAMAACECWRSAAARKLTRIGVEGLDPRNRYEMLPGVGLVALIQTWIDEGPPGPRPCPLRLDEAVFERGAASIRRLDDEAMAPYRERLGHHAVLAYRIGAWTIVLGPFLARPEQTTFWEDQILVMRDGQDPAVVLMSDPWDRPTCFVVDGNPHVFRGFAVWLGELLRRSGHDERLRSYREDDEDDDGEPRYDEFTVSTWLRFGEAWREEVERDELLDWRIQRDIVIPGARFWCSGIYGHSDARKAELARGVETWHRFLREVIDPQFVGQTPDPPR